MMLAIAGGAGLLALISKKKDPMAKTIDESTAAQRRMIYAASLDCKDPDALRKVAAAFRAEGCDAEADMLDKRVAIYEVPKELQIARRESFRKLMRCTDPTVVRNAAVTFEQMGCTGAAANLNRYAAGLEQAATITKDTDHGNT